MEFPCGAVIKDPVLLVALGQCCDENWIPGLGTSMCFWSSQKNLPPFSQNHNFVFSLWKFKTLAKEAGNPLK